MKYFMMYLVIINIAAFLTYGMDKWKASKNAWRISEKTLLFLALIGGSIGALAGMYVFRHKTKHLLFTICVPVIMILHIILLYWIIR